MNLKNNFEDISCDNTLRKSTLIALTETWLEEGSTMNLEGFKSHFNSVGPGKGIAVFYKEASFKHFCDIKKPNMQLSKLESSLLDIIVVYRSERGKFSRAAGEHKKFDKSWQGYSNLW